VHHNIVAAKDTVKRSPHESLQPLLDLALCPTSGSDPQPLTARSPKIRSRSILKMEQESNEKPAARIKAGFDLADRMLIIGWVHKVRVTGQLITVLRPGICNAL
jgi:hypothetical protein